MKAYLLVEDNEKKKGRAYSEYSQRNVKVVPESNFLSEIKRATKDSTWITGRPDIIQKFIRSGDSDFFKIQGSLKRSTMLIFGEENADSEKTMNAIFKKAILLFSRNSGLTGNDVLEILNSDNAKDLILSGTINHKLKTIVLTRGDFNDLVVPLTAFKESGDGIKPDFTRFSIIDGGQTLKFGEYEASVDSILYEFDPEYRKRLKKERTKSEKSFGACLRRLRIQKGLLQSDFPGIDEKIIGRIERGEVKKPRKATLNKIASILGVAPEDIMNY